MDRQFLGYTFCFLSKSFLLFIYSSITNNNFSTNMALMVNCNVKPRCELITNRTCQAGGSCGGDKKAGIVSGGPSWCLGNFTYFLNRANHRSEVSYFFNNVLNTTRRPVQSKGSRMVICRGIAGLG